MKNNLITKLLAFTMCTTAIVGCGPSEEEKAAAAAQAEAQAVTDSIRNAYDIDIFLASEAVKSDMKVLNKKMIAAATPYLNGKKKEYNKSDSVQMIVFNSAIDSLTEKYPDVEIKPRGVRIMNGLLYPDEVHIGGAQAIQSFGGEQFVLGNN